MSGDRERGARLVRTQVRWRLEDMAREAERLRELMRELTFEERREVCETPEMQRAAGDADEAVRKLVYFVRSP